MLLLICLIAQANWNPDFYETKSLCSHPANPVFFKDSTHSFDVLKYVLDLTVPMNNRSLSGTNQIKCRSNINNLTAVTLNRITIITDSVRINGVNATYASVNETLHINLPTPYNINDSFTIYIRYHGSWSVTANQYGFIYYPRNYNATTRHAVGYTMSECWDARRWMPCYDLPSDKAEQGCIIKITTPDSFYVAANGQLTSLVTNPGNTRTFTYQEDYPIPTYLMHFGISRFARWSQWAHPATGDSVEIRNFMWPEDSTQSRIAFQYVPAALYLFDSLYGTYPFDRYGQDAVYPFAWGGMEHQTQTTIHRNWIVNSSENGMAHELSHQWGGDMVTCVDFRDIWLNEGFATYSDANYNWYRFGHANFISTMLDRADDYFLEDASNRRPLYDPPTNDIFSWGYSYCKGSWVYHMLRYLNQPLYFSGINAYLDSFAYKCANTEDIKRIFNQTYCTDLAWFFNEWVYGQGHPEYNVYWVCNPSGPNYLFETNIYQVQVNAPPVFHMPVPILLHMTGKDTTVTIPVSASPQHAEFTVSQNITSIVFDPDTWILCRSNIYVVAEEVSANTAVKGTVYLSSNPARERSVEYSVTGAGNVRLAVYDINGRLAQEIFNGYRSAGRYSAQLGNLASGVYFLKLETASSVVTSKIVIVK